MAKKKTHKKNAKLSKKTKEILDSQTTKTKKENTPKNEHKNRIIKGLILILVGIIMFASVFFNYNKVVLVQLSFFSKGILGLFAYLLPFYLILLGIFDLRNINTLKKRKNVIGTCGILISLSMIICIAFSGGIKHVLTNIGEFYIKSGDLNAGGILGFFFDGLFVPLVGGVITIIIAIFILLFSIFILNNFKIPKIFETVENSDEAKKRKIETNKDDITIEDGNQKNDDGQPHDFTKNPDGNIKKKLWVKKDEKIKSPLSIGGGSLTKNQKDIIELVKSEDKTNTPTSTTSNEEGYEKDEDIEDFVDIATKNLGDSDELKKQRKTKSDKPITQTTTGNYVPRTGKNEDRVNSDDYIVPSVSLLKDSKSKARQFSDSALKALALKLERILQNFRVEAKVTNIVVGPTVTRYEVIAGLGVKIGDIKSLENDIALNLGVKSARVTAMHGEGKIGIECYNDNPDLVLLKDILTSNDFNNSSSPTLFGLGKNISGKPILADLKKMPHLLIAGTTGSGKSVCINCILTSFLLNSNPDTLKMILIDPKVVELEQYNNIPHLLFPVVTDPDRASVVLSYAVQMMEERYKEFAEIGVRDIDTYNIKVQKNKALGKEYLPKVVIVIDELADLMMVASAKVQDSISRLAQKARACGMHLIVATQQPLANILTSVIKANIPSRIAFAVSSATASRVILDKGGAESLLGNGDMLFAPIGAREPIRLQGAFISDSEIRGIVKYIKDQKTLEDYNVSDPVSEFEQEQVELGLKSDSDELLPMVKKLVIEEQKASTSLIQRRFRIGYNRAATIIDLLENEGIIGPADGAKPREVLIDKDGKSKL